MGKYEELSRKALEALGGVENITHVTHCATRLRISYARKSVVNEESLKDLPGSAGIVNKDKQIQIIIGPGVHDAYEEFLEISGWREGRGRNRTQERDVLPEQVRQLRRSDLYASRSGHDHRRYDLSDQKPVGQLLRYGR